MAFFSCKIKNNISYSIHLNKFLKLENTNKHTFSSINRNFALSLQRISYQINGKECARQAFPSNYIEKTKHQEDKSMTTLELNAELFRQLSVIAEDESFMKKALKAIKRLAKQKKEQADETEYISKEEVLEGIRQGYMEMKAGKGRPFEDFMRDWNDTI